MSDEVYGRTREHMERAQNETERMVRENANRAADITEQVMKDQIHRTAELTTSGLTVLRHMTEYNAKVAHNIGDLWQGFFGNTLNEMVRQTQRFTGGESNRSENEQRRESEQRRS